MDLPSALQLNKETSIAATTKKGHDPRQALAQLHLADRAVNHSFFQRHEIKEGLLTPAVKQLILEAPFRPQQIDEDTIPRKIICRTHTGFRSRTTKELAVEKMERKRINQITGFNADPKSPYRALGEPILESQELVYKAMHIDNIPNQRKSRVSEGVYLMRPGAVSSTNALGHNNTNTPTTKDTDAKSVKQELKPQESNSPGDKTKHISETETSVRRCSNGFSSIKSNVKKSSRRLLAVRVGIPFAEAQRQADESNSSRPSSTASRKTFSRASEMSAESSRYPSSQSPSRPESISVKTGHSNLGQMPAVHFESEGWVERLIANQLLEKKKDMLDKANAPKHFGPQSSKKNNTKELTKKVKMIPMSLFELDMDKRAAYLSLHERYQTILATGEYVDMPMSALQTVLALSSNEYSSTARRESRASSAANASSHLQQNNETQQGQQSATANQNTLSGMTVKIETPDDLEGGDQIARENPTDALERGLKESIQRFRHIQEQSVQNMNHTMQKLDADRWKNFRRKWDALSSICSPHTHMHTGFSETKQHSTPASDLRRMRNKASEVKVAQRLEGFNDILGVILYGESTLANNPDGTNSGKLKPKERQLLKRVRQLIEQDADFTKDVFVQLLKMITPMEFLRENVQKIFRFLKNSLFKISEREYLELLSKNGYSLSGTMNSPTAIELTMNGSIAKKEPKKTSRRNSIRPQHNLPVQAS